MNFRLKITRDQEVPFEFTHIGLICTVGKRKGHLLLHDDLISDLQCSLIIQEEYYLLVDHNSKNGTSINDKIVGQSPIQEKDVIKIGNYYLEILELHGRDKIGYVFSDPKLEEIYQWIMKNYSSHLATF